MRDKLLHLMKIEGLTASKLAEYLGIQPSSISHILGGRNKPSLDFVQKILQRYPRLNPDWLLLDSDEMYRPSTEPQPTDAPDTPPRTETESESSTLQFTAEPAADSQTAPERNPSSSPQPATTVANVGDLFGTPRTVQHGGVRRIIVLYEDRTFESYEAR